MPLTSALAKALLVLSLFFCVHVCTSEQSSSNAGFQVSTSQGALSSPDFSTQLNRLYALVSLENEISWYVTNRNWLTLQNGLQGGKWEQAAQILFALSQSAVSNTATQRYQFQDGTIRYKPGEDESDRPVWQDGDTLHLQILLDEIGYDSRQLGMDVTTIGASAEGTEAVLNRLIGQINVERDRLLQLALSETKTTVVGNEYSQDGGRTWKPLRSIPGGKTLSGPEYASERQKYVAALNAAYKAQSSCSTKATACFDSCVSGGDTSTIGANLQTETRCAQQCGKCNGEEAAIYKAQKALSDFERANNYGYPAGKKQ